MSATARRSGSNRQTPKPDTRSLAKRRSCCADEDQRGPHVPLQLEQLVRLKKGQRFRQPRPRQVLEPAQSRGACGKVISLRSLLPIYPASRTPKRDPLISSARSAPQMPQGATNEFSWFCGERRFCATNAAAPLRVRRLWQASRFMRCTR